MTSIPETKDEFAGVLPQSDLEAEFYFDRNGHELIDLPNYRGRVVKTLPRNMAQERVTLKGNPIPESVRLFDIFVEDPLIKADREGYQLVHDYVKKLGKVMLDDGIPGGKMLRTGALTPRRYNRYTRAWLAAPHMEAMRHWRTLVPTAMALDYLLEPKEGRLVTDRKMISGKPCGERAPMSPEVAMLLGFGDDAVGIRERSVGMEKIATDSLLNLRSPGHQKRWLSLASGTAEPSIAACRAAEEAGIKVSLDLVDLDDKALSYSEGNALKYGFDNLRTHHLDILSPNLDKELSLATDSKPKYDVVEALGFLEYLKQGGDEVEALGNPIPVKASEFVRQAVQLVNPDGGVLILGNMIVPRPQDYYVFNVVDWPLINGRSEENIVGILADAGILDNSKVDIQLYRVQDAMQEIHLYDIVKVTVNGELKDLAPPLKH